jgi:hypothetical protein
MADGEVYALSCDSSGNLFAGGTFTNAGGVATDYIARWDGASWSSMGTLYGAVYALLVDGSDNVLVGTSLNFEGALFRWNGINAFSGLGTFEDGDVLSLAMDSAGNLYIGGRFTDRIIMWDGATTWSTLGAGINDGQVNALALDSKDNLFAGGTFTTGGGSPADYLAQWDGNSWSGLGSGINGPVLTLDIDNADNIYAGGSFNAAGGSAANNIVKWTGSSWSALGSGTNSEVACLRIYRNSGDLYAGGVFTTAGAKESRYIGWFSGLPTKSSSFSWVLFLPAIISGK